MQYVAGIATELQIIFISVGEESSDATGGFLAEADALMALDSVELPQVVSTSFESNEVDFADDPELAM